MPSRQAINLRLDCQPQHLADKHLHLDLDNSAVALDSYCYLLVPVEFVELIVVAPVVAAKCNCFEVISADNCLSAVLELVDMDSEWEHSYLAVLVDNFVIDNCLVSIGVFAAVVEDQQKEDMYHCDASFELHEYGTLEHNMLFRIFYI